MLYVVGMMVLKVFSLLFQEEDVVANEISKRERARLKEMQRVKKQKIQEILDIQNAAIEADMVCYLEQLVTWNPYIFF